MTPQSEGAIEPLAKNGSGAHLDLGEAAQEPNWRQLPSGKQRVLIGPELGSWLKRRRHLSRHLVPMGNLPLRFRALQRRNL